MNLFVVEVCGELQSFKLVELQGFATLIKHGDLF